MGNRWWVAVLVIIALVVAGLLYVARPARAASFRQPSQRSLAQRGRCSVCRRLVALTADGRVPRHNGTIRAYTPPEECPGSGRHESV
ncbi:hypothetical protein Asi03nite_65330 [Actinoplanes siamensis]|uniref:Uncharacterized protein n=1 Tax=Actinoplanes siamensis TaxID=1223317 RepID=A0A919TPL5_9ACTN|nr:hypothetical protein Asi03nite_65330 [Actinoplanes siamensis]